MLNNIILEYDRKLGKFQGETIEECEKYADLSNVHALQALTDTTDCSLSSLAEIFPHLEKLKLDNSNIPDIRDIGCMFSNLKVLSLGNCHISSLDGIITLSSKIEELYLPYNEIEDVSDLVGIQSLKILNLQNNNISDILNIEFLSYCPNLTSLFLDGNPCLKKSKNFKEKIHSLVPNLIYLDDSKIISKVSSNSSSVPCSFSDSLSIPCSSPDIVHMDSNQSKESSSKNVSTPKKQNFSKEKQYIVTKSPKLNCQENNDKIFYVPSENSISSPSYYSHSISKEAKKKNSIKVVKEEITKETKSEKNYPKIQKNQEDTLIKRLHIPNSEKDFYTIKKEDQKTHSLKKRQNSHEILSETSNQIDTTRRMASDKPKHELMKEQTRLNSARRKIEIQDRNRPHEKIRVTKEVHEIEECNREDYNIKKHSHTKKRHESEYINNNHHQTETFKQKETNNQTPLIIPSLQSPNEKRFKSCRSINFETKQKVKNQDEGRTKVNIPIIPVLSLQKLNSSDDDFYS